MFLIAHHCRTSTCYTTLPLPLYSRRCSTSREPNIKKVSKIQSRYDCFVKNTYRWITLFGFLYFCINLYIHTHTHNKYLYNFTLVGLIIHFDTTQPKLRFSSRKAVFRESALSLFFAFLPRYLSRFDIFFPPSVSLDRKLRKQRWKTTGRPLNEQAFREIGLPVFLHVTFESFETHRIKSYFIPCMAHLGISI